MWHNEQHYWKVLLNSLNLSHVVLTVNSVFPLQTQKLEPYVA